MITRWNIILEFKIQRIAKLSFNLGEQLYIHMYTQRYVFNHVCSTDRSLRTSCLSDFTGGFRPNMTHTRYDKSRRSNMFDDVSLLSYPALQEYCIKSKLYSMPWGTHIFNMVSLRFLFYVLDGVPHDNS